MADSEDLRSSQALPLRQQVHFLKQKLAYQQQLLDDERRITDDLLLNKNRAIEQLQAKLGEQERQFQALDRERQAADREAREKLQQELTQKYQQQLVESDMSRRQFEQRLQEQEQQRDLTVNQAKEAHQQQISQLQEEYRKSLRKFSQQNDQTVAVLKTAHQEEIKKIREEAKHAIESTYRKLEMQVKQLKREYEQRLKDIRVEFDRKDQLIGELKDKCVQLTRAVDKKADELARNFQKDQDKQQQQAQQHLEATKKQMQDLVRKVEQRCFKLDAEKQIQRQQYEEKIQELTKQHKEQLARVQEERFKTADELKREYEARYKAEEQVHAKEVDALSQRHREEIEQLTRESSAAMRQLQADYEKQATENAKRIMSMEDVIQKLRMQTVVQDSYWRKKEQKSTDDVQRELQMVQSNHENSLKAHKIELARQERLLDAKQAKLHEAETQILLMKRQMTEMKIQMDAKRLDSTEEVKTLAKKVDALQQQLEQDRMVKQVLERRIQEAAADVQDRNETIRRLQSELRSLTEEVDRLRNERDTAIVSNPVSAKSVTADGRRSLGARSSPSKYQQAASETFRASTRSAPPARPYTTDGSPIRSKNYIDHSEINHEEVKLSWEPVDDAGPRVIIDAEDPFVTGGGMDDDDDADIGDFMSGAVDGNRLDAFNFMDGETPSRAQSRPPHPSGLSIASPLERLTPVPVPPPVFDRVRKDLHHVIESHMDRIESLTNELKRTKTLSDSAGV